MALHKILNQKQIEALSPAITAGAAGCFFIAPPSSFYEDMIMYFAGASAVYGLCPQQNYTMFQLPNSGIAGTFGAGACGDFHYKGPTGTATAGTTTTITTNLTLTRSIAGANYLITAGTNAGVYGQIVSNTIGANSVLTVATNGVAYDNTSQYILYTGRYWVFNAGTAAVGFSYYDYALNTWTSRSVTGLPTAWGTDGHLICTPGQAKLFATGTATSGGATTIVKTGAGWAASQWIGYQVRIISGTGKGQTRVITASTSDTLTVATWGTNPDNTSAFYIEGNDDAIWLMGNGAVTLYKYSISGNSWATITPAVARAAAPTTCCTASWVNNVSAAAWTSQTAIINGRRIYSFRGSAGAVLDYYDIPSNSWGVETYSPATTTFTTGSSMVYDGGDYIYIYQNATGYIFRYDLQRNFLVGWYTITYPDLAANNGQKMFSFRYSIGGVPSASDVIFIHVLYHALTNLWRIAAIDTV